MQGVNSDRKDHNLRQEEKSDSAELFSSIVIVQKFATVVRHNRQGGDFSKRLSAKKKLSKIIYPILISKLRGTIPQMLRHLRVRTCALPSSSLSKLRSVGMKR